MRQGGRILSVRVCCLLVNCRRAFDGTARFLSVGMSNPSALGCGRYLHYLPSGASLLHAPRHAMQLRRHRSKPLITQLEAAFLLHRAHLPNAGRASYHTRETRETWETRTTGKEVAIRENTYQGRNDKKIERGNYERRARDRERGNYERRERERERNNNKQQQ